MFRKPLNLAIISILFIFGVFSLRIAVPHSPLSRSVEGSNREYGSELFAFASSTASSSAFSRPSFSSIAQPKATSAAAVLENSKVETASWFGTISKVAPRISNRTSSNSYASAARDAGSQASESSAAASGNVVLASSTQNAQSSVTSSTVALVATSSGTSTSSNEANSAFAANQSAAPQTQARQEPASAAPVASSTEQPSPSATEAPRAQEIVCNESVFSGGASPYKMIDLQTCEKLNVLFASGKAAGNKGDLYDNRDALHVNFCNDWTPNPDCPQSHSLFPQVSWRSSSAGRATTPTGEPTLGQASYSGSVEGSIKHSIPYDMYKNQSGADTLYRLYTNNNLYAYPSLVEESFLGGSYDAGALSGTNGFDPATENIANTPYVISSKQICDCGAGTLRVHDASGSDLPFMELGFAGLAAFKPDVKRSLIQKGMLMPTLQAMIRYAHRSVSSDESYLTSPVHQGMYMAHYLEGGSIKPAFNSGKLVDTVNNLSLSDVPPVVKLSIVSESFGAEEKLFDTPGAIARIVSLNSGSKTMAISAEGTTDAAGSKDFDYKFVVLGGKATKAKVSQEGSKATIAFNPDSAGRIDVAVFARKPGGRYYSAPAMVSVFVRP